MSEKEPDISFLQEKIKERPVNRKKLIRRTLITAIMAMVFGLVACVTFSLLEPVISRMLYPEEEAEIVSFPEEKEEVNPEDMAADEEELEIIREEEAAENSESEEDGQQEAENASQGNPEESPAEEENEPGETAPEGEGEEELLPGEEEEVFSPEKYESMYAALGGLKEEAEKSIVTVTTVTSDVNWINDTLENTGVTSGLLIADNRKELLVLADYSGLQDADKIFISFSDGEEKKAEIKGTDLVTGLAVLAVPLSDISGEQRENIVYASLGSSLGKGLVGQPVMAIGSPVGISGSVCYGMVTSQGTALGMLDSNYKLLTTDIYGSKNASGVLVNMKGQVVGILYNGYVNKDMENQLCAIGMSELKRTVERLSNGEEMVYLGVHGAEINTAVKEENNIPDGAYVTQIDMGSPAMRAGVQSGDIVTKVNDAEIKTYGELINILMRAKPGDSMTLKVARQGQEEYQEMEVEVVLEVQS